MSLRGHFNRSDREKLRFKLEQVGSMYVRHSHAVGVVPAYKVTWLSGTLGGTEPLLRLSFPRVPLLLRQVRGSAVEKPDRVHGVTGTWRPCSPKEAFQESGWSDLKLDGALPKVSWRDRTPWRKESQIHMSCPLGDQENTHMSFVRVLSPDVLCRVKRIKPALNVAKFAIFKGHSVKKCAMALQAL